MSFLRCLSGIVAICMTVFLAGCQNEHGLNPDEPIQITLWHYYNSAQKTAFDSMVDEFNQTEGLEKGIIVKAYSQSSPGDLAQALLNAATKQVGAEQMPDIFATYVDTAQEIDRAYGLADIDDYMTKKELSAYVPSYLEEGRMGEGNKLKVLPVAKSTEILMVNATDWVPFAKKTRITASQLSTWEGLADVAEKYYHYTNNLTPTPNDGKAFFCRDALANYIIIGSMQMGKEIFVQDENGGHAQLDKEAMRRIWKNYYIPYVKGYYAKQGRFASDDVKTGSVIASVGSCTGATFYPKEVYDAQDNPHPVELSILPLPNFEGAKPMAVQQGAGMAIAKTDETREYASAVFLKWFTQVDRNLKFAAQSAYLPVTREGNKAKALDALKENDDIMLSPEVEKAIRISIAQMKSYQIYTSKPIYNGYAVRELLENSLNQKAQNDQKAVKAALASGQDRSAALAKYVSNENFEDWFLSVNYEIEVLMERD